LCLIWKKNCLGSVLRSVCEYFWVQLGEIPADENLWRSVNNSRKIKKNSKNLKPNFFVDKNGLSCDLAKFTNLEQTRLGYVNPKFDSRSGVVAITPKIVSEISKNRVRVLHRPVKSKVLGDRKFLKNYGHCQLEPQLTGAESRELLKRCCIVVQHGFKTDQG